MTSFSSDKMEFDPEDPDSLVIPAYHWTNKEDRRLLSDRMKDPQDKQQKAVDTVLKQAEVLADYWVAQ